MSARIFRFKEMCEFMFINQTKREREKLQSPLSFSRKCEVVSPSIIFSSSITIINTLVDVQSQSHSKKTKKSMNFNWRS